MPLAVEPRRSIDELRDLYGSLHQFGNDLRDAALKFQNLVSAGAFAERGKSFSYAVKDPKHPLNRSIDITQNFEFLVAVTGAFSSGKSSLLNLILDQTDLLPASVIPLTAVCTVVRYGEDPAIKVRYVSHDKAFERVRVCIDKPFKKPFNAPEHLAEALESPQLFVDDKTAQASLRRFAEILRSYDQITAIPITFSEREPFVSGGGILKDSATGERRYFSPTPQEEKEYLAQGGDPRRWVTREWLALIRDVTLWVPSPLLENNIVFLDLPGLNCREDYHRRAIQEYCNMADCILVTAFQPGNQADEEVIANFRSLSTNYHDKIFFVFNKVDQFTQEPKELVRAVDYLARDTIGADFPRERFFLTSGQLARAHRTGEESAGEDLGRLDNALRSIEGSLPGLDNWVDRVTDKADPGGVGNLKSRLYRFLVNDAYPTKIAEVIRNLDSVLEGLKSAASPTFEETMQMDAADLLRKSVLDYYRHVVKLGRSALNRFRFEYLSGPEEPGKANFRGDLKVILEEVHAKMRKAIESYFEGPILSAPLREDPVSGFDLQIIADEASQRLRREFQALTLDSIQDRVREVVRHYLNENEFKQHLQTILGPAPDSLRRFDDLLVRFDDMLLHSLKCIVRNGFYELPRGKGLKRLERTVPMAELKSLLVEVFLDFYPSWIYENIFGEVIDKLWLSVFLDTEDIEDELAEFFATAESVITGLQVAEKIQIPHELLNGSRDLIRSVRMCQEIEGLLEKKRQLDGQARSMGVAG